MLEKGIVARERQKTKLEENLSKRRTVPPVPGAGRAVGQGQSPVCSGGPGGRGEK